MATPLSLRIRAYYESHQAELPATKWRHYLSRMALWGGEKKYYEGLRAIEDQYIGIDEEKTRQRLQTLSQTSSINPDFHCFQRREPFFKKYPRLMSYDRILFLALFARTLYGRDIRPSVLETVSLSELVEFYQQVYQEREMIAVLSTYVINYFYLSRDVFPELRQQVPFSPEYFLDIARNDYPQKAPEDLCLQLYLLTHCIIGESRFYGQKISEHVNLYGEMLQLCETILRDHFQEISLDNKLEYLVCAKILGKKSSLEESIMDEAESSLSPHGDFIIDQMNIHQGKNDTLAKSEHRNVMYLMCASGWKLETPEFLTRNGDLSAPAM